MKRKLRGARTERDKECGMVGIDDRRARHLSLADQAIEVDGVRRTVTINEAESPLIWLARRKGRDGRPLIEPTQFQAGERLRAEFTRANLMPKTTSNWSSPIGASGRERAGAFVETMIASRQRVRIALAAVGPEFAGLLLDVCCFLKGLDEIERSRGWPSRSGKVILQIGLSRLARHYGLETETRGYSHAAIRAWSAPERVDA